MNPNEKQLDARLDEAVEQLRADTLPEAAVHAAAGRVRAQLGMAAAADALEATSTPEPMLRTCEDFQAEIPALLAGSLSPARRLLVEDHCRSCIPCRKALKAARSGHDERAAALHEARQTRRGPAPMVRWAMAAALVLGAGVALWMALQVVPLSWGQSAGIETADGNLFQVAAEGYLPLQSGQDVAYGDTVRTGRDAGAVLRLADGSSVEMSDRAELRVERRLRGTTIHLARGQIIVEAADQGSGHLFVRTDDCEVAVKGTIFSVNHGTKGSRVAVVEGAVQVDYGRQEAFLRPGQQVSTHASLGAVPVHEEIAWSRNVDEYLDVMEQLNILRQDIAQVVGSSNLRYQSELIDLALPNSTVYAAGPNLSSTMADVRRVVEERLDASPVLRQWWQEKLGPELSDPKVTEALDNLSAFGEYLGEEFVLSVALRPDFGKKGQGLDPEDGDVDLLILATTQDEAGLRAFLEAQLADLQAQGEQHLWLVDDPAQIPDNEEADGLYIWLSNGVLAASPMGSSLQQLAQVRGGTTFSFTSSPFYQRLQATYADGVDWLLGVDMGLILENVAREAGEDATALHVTGLLDARYLMLERDRDNEGLSHYRADLSFNGPRRGVAAWLAAPAPMASLDFISPDARMVNASLVKDPEVMARELITMLEQIAGEKFTEQLQKFESEHGISVIEDFAAPLGGEFAFALDGPLVPTPSWKLVAEVYDAARLQNTITWLVDQISDQVEGWSLELVPGEVAGRPAYRLGIAGFAVHYVFVDGYMLMGPSPALLANAIRDRDAGNTFLTSKDLQALLPADGHANFSALAYNRLGDLMGGLMSRLGSGQLTPEQQQRFGNLAKEIPANLACVYGEQDRITFVATSDADLFGALIGLSSTQKLEELLDIGRAMDGFEPFEPPAPTVPASST